MTTRGSAINYLLAGAAVFLLAGCSSGRGDTPTATPTSAPTSIVGGWQLTGGRDSSGRLELGDIVVTLDAKGRNSGGQAPCNAYGVAMSSTTTGSLTITEGIHTDLACAQAQRNVLEQRYFDDLTKIGSASRGATTLVLTGPGIELDYGVAKQE